MGTRTGQTDKELCVIMLLLRRLEDDRIPTVLAMKKRVDRAELLSGTDIEYLERILSDAETFEVVRLLEHHPDYSHLVGAFFSLCRQVIESDLRTEAGAQAIPYAPPPASLPAWVTEATSSAAARDPSS